MSTVVDMNMTECVVDMNTTRSVIVIILFSMNNITQ